MVPAMTKGFSILFMVRIDARPNAHADNKLAVINRQRLLKCLNNTYPSRPDGFATLSTRENDGEFVAAPPRGKTERLDRRLQERSSLGQGGQRPLRHDDVHLADEDLAELVKGHVASDLHQRGKLRIDGDVRLAHKLGLFKGL